MQVAKTNHFEDTFVEFWENSKLSKEGGLSLDETIPFFVRMLQYLKSNQIQFHEKDRNSILQDNQEDITKEIRHYLSQIGSNKQKKQSSKSDKQFDFKKCLECWKRLRSKTQTQNINTYNQHYEFNQFELGKNAQKNQIKNQIQMDSQNKKFFAELSLEQQEKVIKKSLQMVYKYYHHLKIIFNHYNRFSTQKQHKRTNTFDEVEKNQNLLSMNRFMLFCRDFEIIKSIQFKKKKQNNKLSKNLLMNIFKQNSIHYKYMIFESFLMSIVYIALKIHQNFDPRSFIHIEIFLNGLKLKSSKQFVQKIDSLGIKYTASEFSHCFQNKNKLLAKSKVKQKLAQQKIKESKLKLQQTKKMVIEKEQQKFQKYSKLSKQQQKEQNLHEDLQFKVKQQSEMEQKNIQLDKNPSISRQFEQKSEQKSLRSFKSVPSIILKNQSDLQPIKEKKYVTHQNKRPSLPQLPRLSENKFFTPVEVSKQKNVFGKYLQHSEESSSVYKNRITGYKKINDLKHKRLPLHQNPELLSKEDFRDFINSQKGKYQDSHQPSQASKKSQKSELFQPKIQHSINNRGQKSQSLLQNYKPQEPLKSPVNLLLMSNSKIEEKVNIDEKVAKKEIPKIIEKKVNSTKSKQKIIKKEPSRIQQKTILNNSSNISTQSTKRKIVEAIKSKVDILDQDEILNKHLLLEQAKQKQVTKKLIQAFGKYKIEQNKPVQIQS